MTDRFDQQLEDELSSGFSRMSAHSPVPVAGYRSEGHPSRSKKYMSLFSALPAFATAKVMTVGAAAALAAGGGATALVVSNHHAAPPAHSIHHVQAAQDADGTGDANEQGGSANHDAKPDAGHGLSGAVEACKTQPPVNGDHGIGDCVSDAAHKAHRDTHTANPNKSGAPRGAEVEHPAGEIEHPGGEVEHPSGGAVLPPAAPVTQPTSGHGSGGSGSDGGTATQGPVPTGDGHHGGR